MKSILDPTFCYTPSLDTDISKTFARIRREQRNQQVQSAQAQADVFAKVRPLRQRTV